MAVRYIELASAPSNTCCQYQQHCISVTISLFSISNGHSFGITLWTSVILHKKNIKIESLCPWICYTFRSAFTPNNFLLSGYIYQQKTRRHTQNEPVVCRCVVVKSVLPYGWEKWKVTSQIINKLKTFANRCLWRIMSIRWPKIISPTELWEATGDKFVIWLMRMRKWQWMCHTLRYGDESIEKQTLGWNPQGARWRGRPKQNSKRTVLEEAGKWGKTWIEV